MLLFYDNSDATGMTNDTATRLEHEHSGISDNKKTVLAECIALIVSN